jgi:hypothetical protein
MSIFGNLLLKFPDYTEFSVLEIKTGRGQNTGTEYIGLRYRLQSGHWSYNFLYLKTFPSGKKGFRRIRSEAAFRDINGHHSGWTISKPWRNEWDKI